jgi:hypothetical protein
MATADNSSPMTTMPKIALIILFARTRRSMNLDISELEAASAFWESVGYAATVIVVIGVIGESIADLTTWIKVERRKHVVERVSVLLLIAGLTAEILAQVQSNNKNSLIVGVLNESAGKAEKAAAEAKLALAKMNADRIITGEDIAKLTATLRQYSGKTFWIIIEKNPPDIDSEQELLGRQLTGIFFRAGWRKDNHWSQLDPTKEDPEFIPVSNRGCQISFSDDSKGGAAGRAVVDSLLAAGIECHVFASQDIKLDHVAFDIGLR